MGDDGNNLSFLFQNFDGMYSGQQADQGLMRMNSHHSAQLSQSDQFGQGGYGNTMHQDMGQNYGQSYQAETHNGFSINLQQNQNQQPVQTQFSIQNLDQNAYMFNHPYP